MHYYTLQELGRKTKYRHCKGWLRCDGVVVRRNRNALRRLRYAASQSASPKRKEELISANGSAVGKDRA